MADYLPPGWTETRLTSATPEEIAALPDDQYDLVMERMAIKGRAVTASVQASAATRKAEVDASRAVAGLPSLDDEAARMQDEEEGGGDLAQVQAVLDQMGWEEWGFVVVRTGYGDERLWGRFREKWEEDMRRELVDMGAQGSLEEAVAGKLKWIWVEEVATLADKGVGDVRATFQAMKSQGKIPEGLADVYVCLMVDEEAMKSVVDATEGECGWVTAVDGDYAEEDIEEGEEYRGEFKIAVDQILGVWEIFGSQRQLPEELDPGEGKVYKGFLD